MLQPLPLIDVHAHLAAFPTADNRCWMSPGFMKSPLVRYLCWKKNLPANDPEGANRAYLAQLVSDLRSSTLVDQAVLLALDGVYGQDGNRDENRTHMLVSNDAVFAACAEHPDVLLAGASVNPARRDALEELDRVAAMGARLVKVLPNSQSFDPGDERYRAFFRRLADARIPLLSHIGYEFSVTSGDQSFGDPLRLRLALDEGVSVIGAHACSSAVFFQGSFARKMSELTRAYSNFYMDLSATTLPNRASVLWRLAKETNLHDRLIFGTDYPLAAYATPFLGRIPVKDQIRLWRTRNIFDKQASILARLNIATDRALAMRLLKIPSASGN